MVENPDRQKRIEFVDLFRAFGIILMIMGHVKFGGFFGKWIHAFHMPMFFFISGWFYKSPDNHGAVIVKKARGLLLPYLCFETLQWFAFMIFVPEYRSFRSLYYILLENTYKIPIANGTFGISPIPGAMWFLTSLFFAEIIYILLDKLFGFSWKIHVASFILVLIGMLAPTFLPFRLPWALDASFVGLGFFHAARIIRATKAGRLMDLKVWQALVAGVVFSFLIIISPEINLRTGVYGWFLPFWVNAIGAIVVGWNISGYIDRLLNHGKFLTAIGDWLKSIGRNSIVYLCLNQAVIVALTKVFYLVGINGVMAKIPILIFAIAVLFVFEKLICNTKLKVIIGR